MTINPIIVQMGGGGGGLSYATNSGTNYPANITGITIPASVTSIGNYAFYGCTSLASIDIPAGVTSIGNYAFNGCTSLASITIPAGVTSIGANAFNACSALMTMDVLRATPPSLAPTGLSGAPATCSIRVPAGSVGAYKAAPYWSARAAYITALP